MGGWLVFKFKSMLIQPLTKLKLELGRSLAKIMLKEEPTYSGSHLPSVQISQNLENLFFEKLCESP